MTSLQMGRDEIDGLTVLVPAFNEATTLAASLTKIHSNVAELGVSFEILVVNDGSRDETGAIADDFAARDAHVRVFHHDENRRIGAVLRTGIAAARHNRLVLNPVDNPISSDELRRLLEASQHAAVAAGRRAGRPGYTMWMRSASATYNGLLRILFGVPLRDFNWCCLYRTDVLRSIVIRHDGILGVPEVLIRAYRGGHRIVEVPLSMRPRVSGRPTVSRLRTIRTAFLDMLDLFWELRVRGSQPPEGVVRPRGEQTTR